VSQTVAVHNSASLLFPGDGLNASRPRFRLRPPYASALFSWSEKRPRRLRAHSLRDAAEYISVPAKLAQILGRPRQLVDNWLPISIPDGLARAFGGNVSLDAGRALLRSRLAKLCAWLSARLDEPPEVVEHGPSRQITVFGCVGYNIDFVSRRISTARIHANGMRQELSAEVEVMRPLATGYWLHWVLEDLGLGASQAQLSLFGTPQEARWHDDWLVGTAYGLLKNDPRFESLRSVALPRAFALNRGLLALALHARHADWAPGCMPSSTFNLVWRHDALFQRVARENRQLLKLLELFLVQNKLPLKKDPVAEMRDYFRARGFSEAAWRYVHKYGSRLFRVASEIAMNKNKLEVCVHYLRALETAGFPPPPAPALAMAWFRCFAHPYFDRMWFTANWWTADPSVIRAVLMEADKRRCEPGFASYIGEAVGVLHWAMETRLSLNPQQARSGWKWLHRRWVAWRNQCTREAKAARLSWRSRLPRTTIGRFEVVPIETGAGLIEEAIAMHNCADTFVVRCKSGDLRLFSVRHARTGKRVATLGITSFGGCWSAHQVKRSANRPASRELEDLMTEIARLYTERCAAGSVRRRLALSS
jgi:hypothetical protein